tara:strand:+ start:251 stop:487 length:237 start_codon:yes stop_codon:yes gene_type:complete
LKIKGKGNNFFHVKHDFIIFNRIDFTFLKIEIPNFDSIVIPEMNFDFNFDINFDSKNIMINFDDLDKNLGNIVKYSFE